MKTSVGLLALASLVAATHDDFTTDPCRGRAWVRAPDLEPGRVIQGDVKVKLDGTCDDVSSYSVGLRFSERSWVKTRREDVEFPERPTANQSSPNFSNDGIYEPDMAVFKFWSAVPGVTPSAWEKYQSDMKNPALWLVREEERIGFETTFILAEGQRLSHELVETFGVLVPFTNYPPAIDMSLSMFTFTDTVDSADTEHIYAYFVNVTFANGTHREIPAGYTSFRPVIQMPQPATETIKVPANRSTKCEPGHHCPTYTGDSTSRDEFTLEITFPNGRHVEQGSANNVTLISHQLGPGLQRPLGLQSLETRVNQKREWAASLAVDNETAKAFLSEDKFRASQIVPVIDDEIFYQRFLIEWVNRLESPRFSQTGLIENGTEFSTEAITVPFKVPQECCPTFNMYYQSTEVTLKIALEVRNVSSAEIPISGDSEEYEWTPKKESTEILQASIPIFVYPRDSETFNGREPTHYLSLKARTPILVDHSSVAGLQLKTLEDRDELAPTAQAKIVTWADGDIVKHRYYGTDRGRGMPGAPYYVGDTWLRKVLAKAK